MASHHTHTALMKAVFCVYESSALSEENATSRMGYTKGMYYVYMIKNAEDSLYVGITKDPTARLKTHNTKSGSTFTRNRSHFKIVFLEQYVNLKQARTREIQLKKWRRDKKEVLIMKYMQDLETRQGQWLYRNTFMKKVVFDVLSIPPSLRNELKYLMTWRSIPPTILHQSYNVSLIQLRNTFGK